MALGGRWGRSEDDGDEVESDNTSEADASGADGVEPQVVEPSEVRTESDPWSD